MSSVPINISVVIPLYNKAEYVVETVLSTLAQETTPSEVIVVDDGSTDSGAELVAALSHPLVRLHRQVNAGVSAARNAGLKIATGDLVNFLDADDLHRPNFLSEISELVGSYPDAIFYATGYERLLPGGVHQSVKAVKRFETSRVVNDFFSQWSRGSFTYTSAICVRRRQAVDGQLLFPVGERWGEDQDFWFRLAEKGELAYSPAEAVLYRIDLPGSATVAEGNRTTVLPAYARLADRLVHNEVPKKHRAGVKQLLAAHYLNLAENCFSCGARDEGLELLSNPLARGRIFRYLAKRIRYIYA
jgi:glycosyltransferase involved in cell wall biosynthesis